MCKGKYSPKISEDLLPVLYEEARDRKIPMTQVVDEKLRLGKPVFTTQDLKILICGKKFLLDCGHTATPGHGLSNTLIIYSEGGGIIKTACHNCGY